MDGSIILLNSPAQVHSMVTWNFTSADSNLVGNCVHIITEQVWTSSYLCMCVLLE